MLLGFVRRYRQKSLPSQGARIETPANACLAANRQSLPSQGARIETIRPLLVLIDGWNRSPHRERGLKRSSMDLLDECTRSLPSQGARIETRLPNLAARA